VPNVRVGNDLDVSLDAWNKEKVHTVRVEFRRNGMELSVNQEIMLSGFFVWWCLFIVFLLCGGFVGGF
jgi:hypothetical protein